VDGKQANTTHKAAPLASAAFFMERDMDTVSKYPEKGSYPDKGTYYGVPDDVYFSWPVASKSTLSKMQECPAAAKAAMDGKWPQTEAMAFGSLVEDCLQRPHRVDEHYMESKFATATAKGRFKEVQDNPGVTLVGPGSIERARQIVGALQNHRKAYELLVERAEHQQAVFVWDDPSTGVRCKCKTDVTGIMADDETHYVCDLKTIRADKFPPIDALGGFIPESNPLRWYMRDYKYDWQDNMYLDSQYALDTMRGLPSREHRFFFVFVDSEPKGYRGQHRVCVVEYTHKERDRCSKDIDKCLRQFAECKASGVWPEPSDEIIYAIGEGD
jgi:hypothetical protein